MKTADKDHEKLEKLVSLLRGQDDEITPDLWCQFMHMEKNDFDVALLKDHILHYATRQNGGPFFVKGSEFRLSNDIGINDEEAKQLLIMLRDRARAEIGKPLLTDNEKAHWQCYSPQLEQYEQPWAGSEIEYAELSDAEVDTLADRVANVIASRYPTLANYFGAVERYNETIWPPPYSGIRPRELISVENVLAPYVSHILVELVGKTGPSFSFHEVYEKLRKNINRGI